MEKIETRIDDKMVKDLYRPLYRLSYVAFIVAFAFVIFYVIFSAITKNWLDTLNLIALAVSFLLVICAIFLLVRVNQMLKSAQEFGRTAIYELFDDYLTYEIYRNEEKIEEGKAYYQELLGYKETKDTVFLTLKNHSYIGIKKVDGLVAFLDSKGLKKVKRL